MRNRANDSSMGLVFSKREPQYQRRSSVRVNPTPPTTSLTDLYKFITLAEKCHIAIGLISSLILGLMVPMLYLVFGSAVNEITPTTAPGIVGKEIQTVSFSFFYISGPIFLFGFINFGLWMLVGERVSIHFREKYLEAVLRQDVEWFETTNPAEIPTILNTQCELIKKGTGEKIGSVLVSVGLTFGDLIMSFVVGWSLTLVLLLSAPLLILASIIVTKISQRGLKDNMQAYARAGGQAEETLSQLRTVAAFTGEEHEIETYRAKMEDTLRLGKRNILRLSLSMAFYRFMTFIVFPFAIFVGTIFVREQYDSDGIYSDKYNGATVMTSVLGIVLGFLQLGMAIPNFVLVLQAQAAGTVLFQVINRKPKLTWDNLSASVDIAQLKPEIELKNVSFSYPSRPDIPVLDDFSFTFEAGKTTAIVGATGCGKSTIMQLILRFYDPLEGSVLIGGEPLSSLNLKELRQKLVGYVGQEPVLFNMSIKESIRFGKMDANDQEIAEACIKAHCWDLINELPERQETNVGSMGTGLSGGEKQRIAIARAIVKAPKILLLDEATSALDRKNEALVQASIDESFPGTTKIIIAHRLTTIKNADTIVVLNKGKIVEQGTHEELLERDGVYAGLVKGQVASSEGDEVQIEESEVMGGETEQAPVTEMSGRVFDTQMTEEEYRLMEHVMEEEEKENEKDKLIMRKETRRARRILCAISRERGFLLFLGIMASVVMGSFFPIIGLTFADGFRGLNDLAVYVEYDMQEEAEEAEALVSRNAVYLLVVSFGILLFQFFISFSLGWVSEHVTYHVRRKAFESLLKKSPKWYEDTDHTPPTVVASLQTDTAVLNSITSTALGAIIQSFVALFVGIATSFVFSWKLSLVLTFLAPIAGLTTYMDAKLQAGFSKSMDEDYKPWTILISETVQNYRTVFSFANEEAIIKHFKRSLMLPYKRTVRKSFCSGIIYGVSQFSVFIVNGLSFYIAGALIAEGLLPPDVMLRSLLVMMLSAFGAGQAQQFAPDLGSAKAATERIFNYINEPSRLDPLTEDGLFLQGAGGRIEFKNVWFKYPSRKEWVLRGVSFVIEPGQTVAIAGQSGSGKSTCIQLLERFYQAQKGEILLDGVNIKTINLKHYRQNISLVAQEPVLFNTSIRENIIYGKRDASFEEVEEAAKNANASGFIHRFGVESGRNFESGYECNVGPRGSKLSGGQKQRVAIARAIIKKPRVLLLDEATSALDKESETLVQQALDRVSKNQTTVVVAHRLSTIEKADRIIVVKEGKVVESGTYKQLMEKEKEFYIMAEGNKEQI